MPAKVGGDLGILEDMADTPATTTFFAAGITRGNADSCVDDKRDGDVLNIC